MMHTVVVTIPSPRVSESQNRDASSMIRRDTSLKPRTVPSFPGNMTIRAPLACSSRSAFGGDRHLLGPGR